MAHKDRKTYKKRGTRSCGYGNAQKHRGAGSRGGRGMAGSKKQKWSYVSKYMPDYFGRKGFKRPQKVIDKTCTINVGMLDKILDRLVKDKKASLKNQTYEVNLTELGFDKLLGSGKATHKIAITVAKFSQNAQKKIEAAGGKIETGVPETTDKVSS
jgi:large subunit ribosomal protein L15